MKHLSSEQISSVVAGIRIPEQAHVQECSACGQEVERVQNVLTLFRGSVREWTDKLDHSEIPVQEAIVSHARASLTPHRAPMAWVLAAAALAAAVAIPIYQDSRDRELKAQAERDAQLMDDVNAQLSRSGPMAMDPLMQLMVLPERVSVTDPSKSHGVEIETKQKNGGVQ
jgi:hypothetical protein